MVSAAPAQEGSAGSPAARGQDRAPGAAPVLRKGDRFYQEVVLSRRTACRCLGVDFRHESRAAFLSSFEVEEEGRGPRVVRQRVEAARLDRAGAALEARLNALLQQTQGATFRITLGPGGEVVKFEGARPPVAVARAGALPGEVAFLLQSSLDLDAWKELAQLTFFRPPEGLSPGGRWARPMTHAWGPLGGWVGRVTYAHAGRAAGVDRFDYLLGLDYVPPRGAGGLPFQVGRADFRLQAAGGSIAYDPARGRVTAAEERFAVRGVLAATALGVTSVVEVEEQQHFQLRILERPPPAPPPTGKNEGSGLASPGRPRHPAK